MQRFLDWIDESAGFIIRITYMASGITAVSLYFGAGNLPKEISELLNAILPWLLGFSVETHTYISARRVRLAYQTRQSTAPGSIEYSRASENLKINLLILAGLMLFSMWNQLNYIAENWIPPHTIIALPLPLAYFIRATVIPFAFIAAAFIAPINNSLSAQIQTEAHYLARATFKVARKQWKKKLREMQNHGQDVSSALVQLIEDPAERRIIDTIREAMHQQQYTNPWDTIASSQSPEPPQLYDHPNQIISFPLDIPKDNTFTLPNPNQDEEISADGRGPFRPKKEEEAPNS